MNHSLTIHGMIECHALEHPDHIAVFDKNLKYTYADLNKKANKLAYYLRGFQLARECIIAIAMDRSMDLLVVMLAVLKSGYAYLPIDENHPLERLRFQLKDASVPLIITHSGCKKKFADFSGKIIFVDQIANEIEAQARENPQNAIAENNLAYLIYTSGSTGQPKGVMIEHKSVVNYIKWFRDYTGCLAQDRMDFSSNIIFDMAVTSTLAALASGMQIYICPDAIKKNISEYLHYLARNKINLIKITPGYFKVLKEAAASSRLKLPALMGIILGGEQLYTRDCAAWLGLYPHHVLYNEYGPTEATVAVTVFKVKTENVKSLANAVPIGKPGLNMSCNLDEARGELLIGGAGLARGYLNQEKLTAERFANNRYKTGDICRSLADGNIEFIGRVDHQIKIRGYRIEPCEIEAKLLSHSAISDATVVAREDQGGEKQLIAYYISQDAISASDLRRYLQNHLAEYMVPAFFVKLDVMPLTENGKLDLQALPWPNADHDIVAAENQIENILLNIWKKIFNRQDIGITCNFFDLGGHSLLAARVINAVEQQLHVKLSMQHLYEASSIKELSLVITRLKPKQWQDHGASVQKVSIYDDKNIPLGDFQFLLWLVRIVEPKVTDLNFVIRRRFEGRVDPAMLGSALKWVIENHEVLSYKPKMFSPVQYFDPESNLQVVEKDLSDVSENDLENILTEAANKLMYRKTWFNRKNPWIIVSVFNLKNNMTEMHLSIPHMIFDDVSTNILLTLLDQAYGHFAKGFPLPLASGASFKDFINEQIVKVNESLEDTIIFWQDYLQDINPLTFPEAKIVKNMKNKNYSTWLKVPMEVMKEMKEICSDLSLSMMDMVCAAISLGLQKSLEGRQGKVFANIVKTVRDSEQYINAIGCFLRLDPVKLDLETNLDLIGLAKQIQKERMTTEAWQNCPVLVKMAFLDKHLQEKTFLKTIGNFMSDIYCGLFPKSQLNKTMLKMAVNSDLASMRSKNQFLLNINLFNNFITAENVDNLFGHKLVAIEAHQYDLITINNVLELSFLYNERHDQVYLVVSSNLAEDYRARIGQSIIMSLALQPA